MMIRFPHLWQNLRLVLRLWHRRAVTRRDFAEIDAHLLFDIGVSKAQREAECRKPFWRGRRDRTGQEEGRNKPSATPETGTL